jgi:hypothetical protein
METLWKFHESRTVSYSRHFLYSLFPYSIGDQFIDKQHNLYRIIKCNGISIVYSKITDDFKCSKCGVLNFHVCDKNFKYIHAKVEFNNDFLVVENKVLVGPCNDLVVVDNRIVIPGILYKND